MTVRSRSRSWTLNWKTFTARPASSDLQVASVMLSPFSVMTDVTSLGINVDDISLPGFLADGKETRYTVADIRNSALLDEILNDKHDPDPSDGDEASFFSASVRALENTIATLRLVEAVGYASAFSFKYSPRPGTPGAEMPDHVPEKLKDERLQRLQALLLEQQQAFTLSMVGRTMPTLIEKPGRKAGQRVGRSPWLQPVIIDEKAGEIGDIIDVRITDTGYNSLHAEPA